MRKRRLLYLIIIPLVAYSQMSINERPVSWSMIDIERLGKEGEEKASQELTLRFREVHEANINLDNYGAWASLTSGGRI